MPPAFVRPIVCVAPAAASSVAEDPRVIAARLAEAAQRSGPARAAADPVDDGDRAFLGQLATYAMAKAGGGVPF